MRRLLVVSLLLTTLFAIGTAQAQTCTTIQQGTLRTSKGVILQTGFDVVGYNYQAHEFNGKYCDAVDDEEYCRVYPNDDLTMKWNDAWLSNKDCNDDRLLDMPTDNGGSYRGTGAWVTNHQKGTYIDSQGRKQRFEWFVKIVAAPADAVPDHGIWRAADGTEIGEVIWDDFAVVQDVYTDTGSGEHGAYYVSPYSAGFGKFTPRR